jgi:cell division protein FtsW (lipid II flippase)
MTTIPVLFIVVLVAAIIMHWRIRSGQYKTTRLPLRDRLLWALICIAPPVAVFMSEPHLYMGIVICIIFICVLLYGSKLEKSSEH